MRSLNDEHINLTIEDLEEIVDKKEKSISVYTGLCISCIAPKGCMKIKSECIVNGKVCEYLHIRI